MLDRQNNPQPVKLPSFQTTLGDLTFAEIDESLRSINTRLFVHTKNEIHNGSVVLITVRENGSLRAVLPLIKELKDNPRVSKLLVFAAGVAREALASSDLGLAERFDSQASPLEALLKVKSEYGSPIIVLTPEASIGPSHPVLFAAKEYLDARSIYLMVESLDSSLGRAVLEAKRINSELLQQLSAVLCNDEPTKAKAQLILSELEPEKFITTGTGQSDAMHLFRASRDKFAHIGRTKLGISKNEEVFLFLGDFSDYKCLDDRVRPIWQLKTLELLINTVSEFSKQNFNKTFALLVRPHPGATAAKEILDIGLNYPDLPKNLRIINASKDVCSVDEAIASCNTYFTTTRSELCCAEARGMRGVYLAFDKLGALVFDELDSTLKAAISRSSFVRVIRDRNQLLEALNTGARPAANIGNVMFPEPESAPRIAAKILSPTA